MKRIAFVSHAYFGSIIPLAKRLAEFGYDIDVYVVTGDDIYMDGGINLRNAKANHFIGLIPSYSSPEFFEYLNSERIRVYYYYRTPVRPYKSVPVLGCLTDLFFSLRDRFFCKHINKKGYEIINLVGRYSNDYFITLHRFIKKAHVLTTLHEVIEDRISKETIKPPKLLSYLFSHNKHILLHSHGSENDIMQYQEVKPEYLHVFHFGLFELYRTIKPDLTLNLPDKYILFFGRILPYKGLDLLYETVSHHPDILGEYKIVVAGAGRVECMSQIEKDSSFVCINRHVTNEELVSLISRCAFVVCPYRGISQSGIPQTTFVFGKPVLASDLYAFREVLTSGVNSLLFETDNAEDFSLKMQKMIESYESLSSEVLRFETDNSEFNWNYIAKEYIHLCDSLTSS